jgi:hypothetical protein
MGGPGRTADRALSADGKSTAWRRHSDGREIVVTSAAVAVRMDLRQVR